MSLVVGISSNVVAVLAMVFTTLSVTIPSFYVRTYQIAVDTIWISLYSYLYQLIGTSMSVHSYGIMSIESCQWLSVQSNQIGVEEPGKGQESTP